MLTLAIEISNPGSAVAPDTGQSVALGMLERRPNAATQITVLSREPVAAPSRHDDDLQPAIDRAARAAAISPRAIALVAVSIGPGGFTALRVAVAAAKMIALASRAPQPARCIAVPTALVAAMSFRLPSEANPTSGPIAVALAGKLDSAFITVIDPSELDPNRTSPLVPPGGHVCRAGDLAALAARSITTLLADAHLPQPLREAADRLGIAIFAPRLDAVALLHAAALLAPIDRAQLAPLYGREPEAVTLWRERALKNPSR